MMTKENKLVNKVFEFFNDHAIAVALAIVNFLIMCQLIVGYREEPELIEVLFVVVTLNGMAFSVYLSNIMRKVNKLKGNE